MARKEAEAILLTSGNETGTFLVRNSEHNPLGFSLSILNWKKELGMHVKHYKIAYFPKDIKKKLVYVFIMHTFGNIFILAVRIIYQHITEF
jgi:hypothetical protein